jgi:DNA-binding IclR family transcriptional regulator
LAALQAKLSRTVFLSIIDKDELLYIDKKEDLTNAIRFTSSIGERRPPYWGMSGPLLMAYLPDSEVERLLQRYPLAAYTKKSLTDKWEFKEWLLQIREQGYSLDEGRAIDGISGVSAPVKDHQGKVSAAVSVGFITSSVDAKGVKRTIREVMETALVISKEIGYREPS